MKTYKNVKFDKNNKNMNIEKGSVGVYSYVNIKKCSIHHEEERWHGKEEPFTHCSLVMPLSGGGICSTNVLTGLKLIMKDGTKIYIYISNEANQINSLNFYTDLKEAERVKKIIDKIIDKYK